MINVLVVEDSRVIRDYLVYVLGSDPEIRISDAVCSGEEALASLERHRPDVILMDIHLPGIDGFETTRRIMSADPIPIVICTSTARFDQMHTAMQALEAGALTVIKKPGGFGDPDAEAETAAVISALKLMSEIKLVRRCTGPQRRRPSSPRRHRATASAMMSPLSPSERPPAGRPPSWKYCPFFLPAFRRRFSWFSILPTVSPPASSNGSLRFPGYPSTWPPKGISRFPVTCTWLPMAITCVWVRGERSG